MTKFINFFIRLYNFIRFDIWRITEYELSKTRRLGYRFIKIIILAVRAFIKQRLNVKASALTYSILFAVVPMFALIIAIGRGFGVELLIEKWLQDSFVAQANMIPLVMKFVKKYLETTQGGVFIGIGLAILLYSVMNFFIQVEFAFNEIWQVKKNRSVINQFTMYFSAMLIIPFLIVLSSGLSIYINAILSRSILYEFFSPLWRFCVNLAPYFIDWVMFTTMYLVIPNTKVKFKNALIAGVLAGSAFQLFQILYINGQVLLSRYNVVYGSFAAIPLLLLWLQISCLIVLLGAEISYASQNIQYYDYEMDSKNISRRYKNFLTLFVTHVIVKRFEYQESPLSANEIVAEYKLPLQLINNLLTSLVDANVLIEVYCDEKKTKTYQPAIDINQLTVSLLFDRVECHGAEDFLKNKNDLLDLFWKKTMELRRQSEDENNQILVKDI